MSKTLQIAISIGLLLFPLVSIKLDWYSSFSVIAIGLFLFLISAYAIYKRSDFSVLFFVVTIWNIGLAAILLLISAKYLSTVINISTLIMLVMSFWPFIQSKLANSRITKSEPKNQGFGHLIWISIYSGVIILYN
jgi:hypothetical protein